jgi:two-component system sensor histidine kinase YesM
MKLYKEWRLRPLLLIVFMAFNGVLLLLTTAIIYFSVSQFTTAQISETRLQLLAEAQKQLSERFSDIEETALSISTHPILLDAITSSEKGLYESIRIHQSVNEIINQYLYTKSNISSIIVYSDRFKDIPAMDSERIVPISQIPWKNEMQRSTNADSFWIGAHLDSSLLYNPKSVITYIKKIYSKNGKLVGYLEINTLEDSLSGLFKDNNRQAGTTLILDGGGRLISQNFSLPNHLQAYQLLSGKWFADLQMQQQEGYRQVDIAGTPYLMVYSKPNEAQWRLLEIISLDQVYEQVKKIRNLVWGIGLFGILLSIPMASYLSRRISQPIPEMLAGFKTIESGKFDTRLKEDNKIVEFGYLSKGFNRMTRQLQELMFRLQEENKAKREAELIALQSQINPHFLYNTLDMMNWMAAAKGAHEISSMTSKLAKLFRISLSKGKTFIKIGDELDHSLLYVQIQQARYNGKFHYEETVDPTLKSYFVPKLILQPFIENAIIHGFSEPMEQKPQVHVTAIIRNENDLCFVIEDNGKGLSDWREMSVTMHEAVKSTPDASGSSGYGIKNVHQRIQLYFGPDYGVALFRRDPRGVRVEITLPLINSMEKFEDYFVSERR